jgi:hypothetical protein
LVTMMFILNCRLTGKQEEHLRRMCFSEWLSGALKI